MSHCGRRRGSLRRLVCSEEGFSECWPLPWVRRTGVRFLQLLPPKDTHSSFQPTAWARPPRTSQLPLNRWGRRFYGLEVSLSSEGFVSPKAKSRVERGLTRLTPPLLRAFSFWRLLPEADLCPVLWDSLKEQ